MLLRLTRTRNGRWVVREGVRAVVIVTARLPGTEARALLVAVPGVGRQWWPASEAREATWPQALVWTVRAAAARLLRGATEWP